MLTDVLARIAADTGYHPVDQRTSLLKLLNDAADDMHKKLECNRIFRETTLVVPPDCVVALPSFIGELRGMRMHTNELPFDLHAISSPRYVSTTLSFKFKNWRDLGESSIDIYPTGYGPLAVFCPVVQNPPVSVLIAGKTNLAASIEEVVTLNSTEVFTTNLFGLEITKIASLDERIANIEIRDSTATRIATLYNNQKQTRYKIVDVSQIFWTIDASDGSSFIDVLYKLPLTKLTKDTDSFYAGDEYDVAWYHMAMFFYYNPLEGKEAAAILQKKLAIAAMHSIKDGVEQDIIKKVSYGRNKFYGIFRKYRYFPGSVTNVDHNIQS
jgi:hypothetical protein